MRNLILTLFLILSALVKPAFAGPAEFNHDIPELLKQKVSQESIANQYNMLVPSLSVSSSGNWWDTGLGPGVLEFQDDPRPSDVLSGYGSGFITNVNYHWNGDLNGWNNVKVYLCLIGAGICADVSSTPTGSIPTPYGVYSAGDSIQFYFVVDRSPRLRIYNGPSFSNVSASVEYQ